MSGRTTVVGGVKVISAQLSSIIHAGDTFAITPRSEVLAVQRQESRFLGNEGSFEQFRIYRQSIPEPLLDESVMFTSEHRCPTIEVGWIQIMGMSVAPVLQLGNSRLVDTSNRTKHIRQLVRGRRPVQGDG